jgi:hypothetical protein
MPIWKIATGLAVAMILLGRWAVRESTRDELEGGLPASRP